MQLDLTVYSHYQTADTYTRTVGTYSTQYSMNVWLYSVYAVIIKTLI